MLFGTGTFATGICRELARAQAAPTTVYVFGRDRERARAVCAIGAENAGEHRTRIEFRPAAAHLGVDLRPLVQYLAPRVVVICASEQSPREIGDRTTRWSALVRRAGFALTVPLQLTVVERVARACLESGGNDPIVLNACFPDAVNPILAARGWPVTCGVGNIGTLAGLVCDTADIAPGRLMMLAHHAHLHAPRDPELEARSWIDGQPWQAEAVLAALRRRPRGWLNDRGASIAGGVVRTLLDTATYTGHLPGPAGLPGGFPVTITGTTARVRLPRQMDLPQAIAWTDRVSTADGAVVDTDGSVRFTDDALEAIRPHCPQWPNVVAPADVLELRGDVLDLRSRLRGPPAR